MWPRRTIASLLLVLQLSACYSWTPSKVTPEQAVEDGRTIQVQLTDGSKIVVRNPWIRGDTLGGEQSGLQSRDGQPWAAPMDSVAVINTFHFNGWETSGLVVGVLAVVGALAIAAQDMSFSSTN